MPLTFTAQNAFNNTPSTGTGSTSANFTAQLVGAVPGNGVQRVGNGVVYFNGLTQITDPSVAYLGSSALKGLSTLKAIAGPDGKPILVNPLAGALGFLPDGLFRGPGAKTANVNLLKRIKINERITLQIGASADNVTNTPVFADPNTNINSTSFGRITASGGTSPFRVIVLQGRVYF